MTLAITGRYSGSNGTVSSQTFTSGSFTPSANSRLYVAVIAQEDYGAGNPNMVAGSISGTGGLTWTLVGSTTVRDWTGLTDFTSQAALWVADVGSSPSSQTVTVDANTSSGYDYYYSMVVFDVTGTGLTSVQSKTNSAQIGSGGVGSDSGTLTVTLDSNPTSGNLVVAAFGAMGDATGACAAPSGYTEIYSQSQTYSHLGLWYHTSTATAAVTCSDLGQAVGAGHGIVIEVAEGSGGQTVTAQVATLTLAGVAGTMSHAGPYVVGAGAQAVSSTSGATVTGAWPSGYSAVADDVALLVVAGRHNNGSSLAPSAPAGYSQLSTRFREMSVAFDLQVTVHAKKLAGGESAPSVTVPAAYSTTNGGISAQTLVVRGVNTSTMEDATAVTSDSASGFTWTPTGITTATNDTLAVSVVASSDDNALNFNTANGFTAHMSGASYDTTTGGDHAVGVATKGIPSAGAVTCPTWNQSLVGSDQWAGITLALRGPGTGPQTVTAQVATLTLAGVAGTTTGGAASVTAQVATLTLTGIAGSIGVAQTVAAQVATLGLAGIAGTVTGGPATIAAQTGSLTLAGIAGTVTGGPTSQAGQTGSLTLAGIAGAVTGGPTSQASQVATLTLGGIAGAVAGGPTAVTAQVAAVQLEARLGVVSGGPVAVTAQVATLGLAGVAGSVSIAGGGDQQVTAQVAALALVGLAGTWTAGAATRSAQTAVVALAGVPGTVVAGGVTVTGQTGTLGLVAIAGTIIAGTATVTAQVATLTLTGVVGSVATGTTSISAQVATLTLSTGATGIRITLWAAVCRHQDPPVCSWAEPAVNRWQETAATAWSEPRPIRHRDPRPLQGVAG